MKSQTLINILFMIIIIIMIILHWGYGKMWNSQIAINKTVIELLE